MSDRAYDIFIVGGGINGCGIARDAAGRGYSVCLAEMNDLAAGTSSWSTKLIHGGLRYLEFYEFRLVRESLLEREVLWAMAPHIINPLRFVLPHVKSMRPSWLVRLGLFLYDHLGGRKELEGTRVLDLRRDAAGRPLKAALTRAFEYSDCRVDDSRLVVLNARDAAARGAVIRTRTEVVQARRDDGCWRVTLRDGESGETDEVTAKLLVNAAGPWVDRFLGGAVGQANVHNVRLVKGSHIVVRQAFDHERAYIFQNDDGRIVFAIPYEEDFTLIGTTDEDFTGDPSDAEISDMEIDYLCASVNTYFEKPISRSDIVWSFAGVRPLFDDGASRAQEATRDYVIMADGTPETGVLLNIFGGKITTYRRLSESMLERIEAALGRKGAPWTASAGLPGGDFPVRGRDALTARLLEKHPFLGAARARRLVGQYGTGVWDLLGDVEKEDDLGRDFGAGLTEREVRYLMQREWAVTADDVLWRRTKLGLRFDPSAANDLEAWMRAQPRVEHQAA